MYSTNSSRLKKPHKLRVKRYNGGEESNDDSGPPAAKRAVHEHAVSSSRTDASFLYASPNTSRNESPPRRVPSRKLTPSRIKHYGESQQQHQLPTSPVPQAQVISGGSSDSSSDEIIEHGAGSFPSVSDSGGVAVSPLPPAVSYVQDELDDENVPHDLQRDNDHSDDDDDDDDDDTHYDHIFTDDDEDAEFLDSSQYDTSEGDVRTKETTKQYDDYMNNLTRKMSQEPPISPSKGRYGSNISSGDRDDDLYRTSSRSPPASGGIHPTNSQDHSDSQGAGEDSYVDDQEAYRAIWGTIGANRSSSPSSTEASQSTTSSQEAKMAVASAQPEGQETSGTRALPYLEQGGQEEARPSSAREKKREMERQQQQMAGALAMAALAKRDNLSRTEIPEKPKSVAQEPQRMVQLKSTPSGESAEEARPVSARQKKRDLEKQQQQQMAGALAMAALAKRDNLARTEGPETSKPAAPQEPQRMVQLKSVGSEANQEETRPMSARERKRETERQQQQMAGALAVAALAKKDNLARTDTLEKSAPAAPEERQRMAELKAVANQERAPDAASRVVELRSVQTASSRAMELREKKRAGEAKLAESREMLRSSSSNASTSRVRLPEKESTPNVDIYSGQVIQSKQRGLRSSPSNASSTRLMLPEKQLSPTIDIYSGEVISPSESNDSSMERGLPYFASHQGSPSNSSSQILQSEPTDSAFVSGTADRGLPLFETQQSSKSPTAKNGHSRIRLPEKQYAPNIDIYTGLPIGDKMTDSAASSASSKDDMSDEYSTDSSSVEAFVKIPIVRCCWCCLLILLLAGAAYLTAFLVKDSDLEPGDVPVAERPSPPSPPSPPSLPTETTRAPASTPPTAQPAPTAAPVEVPTTPTTIDLLREFLVAEFPSLEESFQDTGSAQYLALFWLSGNSFITSYSDDRIKQRFALATFYYSAGGDEWINDEFWLTDRNECQWYTASGTRVPCDRLGLYANLELDLNNLSGTIPPELALLSNSLTRLDLTQVGAGPFLMGPIPTEFGALSQLEYLSLKGNFLTGSLPSGIGNFEQLTILDLSKNLMTGALPSEIGRMTGLTELYLHENRFDSTLPTNIGDLVALKKLSFGSNRLEGPIPTEIGNLVLLQDLNMASNRLTLLPSEIGNLSILKSLFAQSNNLSGTIPTEAGGLVGLLNLDLSGNSLSGPIPLELGNMLMIQNILDLSSNQLTGTLPTELGQLLFLRNLHLHSNFLTGEVPASFSALGRLNTIRLEANDLTGSIPTPVCSVFNNSYPVFVTDCQGDLICPCCLFCCEDGDNCQCQFENTGLSFLCSDFSRAERESVFAQMFGP